MSNVNVVNTIVQAILTHQAMIIGPLALDQVKKVSGIKILNADDVQVVGDGRTVLTNLVSQFEKFFGKASIEVCKDAVKEINPPIPTDQLPDILR